MLILIGILAANAIMHAIVVMRYGVGNNNQPFLIFTFVYAVLAFAVYFGVPYAKWAVLIMSIIGLVGLTVTFNKPIRDKTLDKVIWVLDAATVVCAASLLFFS